MNQELITRLVIAGVIIFQFFMLCYYVSKCGKLKRKVASLLRYDQARYDEGWPDDEISAGILEVLRRWSYGEAPPMPEVKDPKEDIGITSKEEADRLAKRHIRRSMNSAEVVCPCGKAKFWIVDGMSRVDPCPECGKRFRGVYNEKTLFIDAVEIK